MPNLSRGAIGIHRQSETVAEGTLVIEAKVLGKEYGPRRRRVTALRDVSLEIAPGVTAVVGPNGAGKTTLLGLILGFLRPSSGSIAAFGQPPRRYLATAGAAYLPERFRLPPEWTVRSAITALAHIEPGGDTAAIARADHAIERMGLEDHKEKPVGALSRGLIQRLGLAQTLLGDHDLVVLDEPTEGLDPLWRVRFRELVGGWRSAGRTVILASHELPEIERLADRAVLLEDGRVMDVLEIRTEPEGPLRYRLELTAGADSVAPAFEDAAIETIGDGRATAFVTVRDAAELSARLAALLDRGGIVRSVAPAEEGLEERVRQRLENP